MRKLMILMILVVAALAVLNLSYQDGIQPDAEYPMANRHIQFYYAGK